MKIQPLGDRVVIEPLEDKGGKTKAGIYLPETADKERPQEGKVFAVGPGKMSDEGKGRSRPFYEIRPGRSEGRRKRIFNREGRGYTCHFGLKSKMEILISKSQIPNKS